MKYDDEYPTCKKTYAVLRIFSDEMDPSSITKLFNISPFETFAKGERNGDRGLLRKFNGWFLSSEAEVFSKDSRRHIDWIISRISEKSSELQELRSKGGEVDISCLWMSVGQGGPILSPPQMKELARLSIEVSWDIYFS